ncbi:carbohydrate kinase [Streptomyces sp. NPDC051217]|uniref:carbohydrate kinase n=1 Tax=Streptomyces sp. NPDC051217 TaxID=3365644 RepID=UPI0037BC85E8
MIVVAGEALIDLVPQPAADGRAGESGGGAGGGVGGVPGGPLPSLPPLLPRLGGGPYNTAVALGRLGTPTAFCSRVSTDGFGAALLDGLRSARVGTSLVQRGPEPTTLAVPSVGSDGSARYGFYTQGTADRLFELPPQLPPSARALALGTCSLVLEPGASAYEALLRREADRGVFTLLDPNIRPRLIPDAGAYRARFAGWLPYLSLLKLSEEDARWLGGVPSGPAAVVLTRGSDGLSVRTRAGVEVSVPAAPVDVVDTIGAGDTVNAALLHQLGAYGVLSEEAVDALDAGQWREILGFAARAAAVTCSRTGAEPPYEAEVV